MRELSCKVHRRVLIPELKLAIRVLESEGVRVKLALRVPTGLRIVRRESLLYRAVGAARDTR
jgi:sRNA-binding carbon storage regulator CsrA